MEVLNQEVEGTIEIQTQQSPINYIPSTNFQNVIQLNEIISSNYQDVFFISNQEERNLKEVVSSKIFGRKKSQSTSKRIYAENGLFSEQIFGPVVSFKCQCATVKVPNGQVCPDCGVEITSSVERRKRYGKIPTVFILSPQAAMLIKNVFFINRIYDNILSRNIVIIEKKSLDIEKIVNANTTTEAEIIEIRNKYPEETYYHISVIYQLPMLIKEYYTKTQDNEYLKLLVELIDNGRFFSDYILVIPPELRPMFIQDASNSITTNDINSIYIKILQNLEKNIYKDTSGFDLYSLSLIGNVIEYYVEMLRQKILSELKSKEGIVRSTLGKRIDFSARSTIVPHNDRTDVVYVPRSILLEVLKLRIARNMSSKYHKPVQFFIPEIENVKNNIESNYTQEIIDELNSILQTDYIRVIINRQPTLHRGSMYGMKIKPWDHNAIGIPKTVCSSMNADFDGDTVALYFILDKKFQYQLEKIEPQNNSINYQDLSYQLMPKQDIIYAMYKLSSTEERRNSLINNNVLDEKYKDTKITSKVLSKILLEKNSLEYLDKIVSMSNIYVDHFPITLGPLDFIYGKDKKLLRDKPVEFTGDVVKDFEVLKEIENELKDRFILSDLIESGARGKYEQVRQITHTRGYLADFYGRLVTEPINKSYIDKFTIMDLYNSTKGVRKSLYDQHGTISKSGYLYRKLSFSSISALKDITEDCGTTKTIKIFVKDEKHAVTLVNRYYYEQDPEVYSDAKLLKVTNPKDIVGKTIYLRSPLTCKSQNYCKTCYPIETTSNYIGLIASQSISERLSQLSLRTFHTSGIATGVAKKEENKAEDIANHLNILLRHFDSTQEIQSTDDLISILDETHSILLKHGNIQQLHLELVTSERLYVQVTTDNKQYLIPYRRYINYFKEYEHMFQDVKLILKSVKDVPHLKSQTLGLLFQNTRKAIGNLLKAKMTNSSILSTPLDKIVLFFTSF